MAEPARDLAADVAAAEEPPLVEARGLAKYFDVSPPFLNRLLQGEPRQILKAVDGLDIAIRKGRTFSLVGESGCGKSTVARLMVGLYRPSAGTVLLGGEEISGSAGVTMSAAQRRRLQMVFQDPYASLNPRWRVDAIVAEPIQAHGLAGPDLAERVAELLTQVGLSASDGRRFPHEFSGGQRQRISIARALASKPEFLVCDEPTSALDVSIQAQILNLMKELQRELGLTYLFISHDLAVVNFITDDLGVMYLGRLVEWGPARRVFERPQHPYTRLLLDAVPDLEMSGRARTPVGGEVPNPLNPPSGCHFHPRCPFAEERCRQEAPRALTLVEGGDAGTAAGAVACHAVEEGRLQVGGG